MADDERLLELLAEALRPTLVEPPAERVAAVRRLAEAQSPPVLTPPVPTLPVPTPPAPSPPVLTPPAWHRRRSWLVAGAGVAAAVMIVAVLALSALVGSDDGRTPATAKGTRADPVSRLRVALLTQDPVAVAQADAELLREAGTLSNYRQDSAVAAHVAAVQFLRDHPSADVLPDVSPPDDEASAGEPPPDATGDLSAGSAPGQDPPPGEAGPVEAQPPTAPADSRSVAIGNVVPRLDGTFQVEFTVAGFTPDASGQPGTYAVRFSFDQDQSPSVWGGPSPWSFPLSAGLLYREVCAHVVDAAGAIDPSTGGCRTIV